MITGLEDDYFCVHNPIPVNVTVPADANQTLKLNLYIGGVAQLQRDAVFYTITRNGANNVYYVNLSEWVRQLMVNFEEIYTYTSSPVEHPNTYVKNIEVRFTNDVGYTESITKSFVHCAVNDFESREGCCDTCCVKVWKCYPFSSPVGGWMKRVLLIPSNDDFLDYNLDICENVDYETSCCKGVYIKWLNENGYYSYWLFPPFKTIERDGNEIMRKPRNIFAASQTSNEDTVGFDTKETVEIRDKIPKQYWNMLKSLIGSPEVYMLHPNWEIGSDEVLPSDWIKIIQNKPKFEAESRWGTAEFDMKFDMPLVYTQKRI